MPRKKSRVTLKPVVSKIAKITEALERIQKTASTRDQERLELKIRSMKKLKVLARSICRSKSLDLWSPTA